MEAARRRGESKLDKKKKFKVEKMKNNFWNEAYKEEGNQEKNK